MGVDSRSYYSKKGSQETLDTREGPSPFEERTII